MIALVRNCAHGSEVATYAVEDEQGRRFVKLSLTPEGRAALRSEIRGWAWYESVRWPGRSQPICRVLRDDRHVLRIEVQAIEGRQGRAAGGLRDNAALVGQAIDQYCALWTAAADGSGPFHGDLSCDNLFDTPGGVVIIDWEHFQPGGVPWGFDAIYLLCESLYFDIARDGTPGAGELRFVARRLQQLHRARPLAPDVLGSPLRFSRDVIRSFGQLWRSELVRYPMKLPIAQMTDADVARVDEAIRSAPRS